MVTLGVDLASLPRRTAVCRIRWADGRADIGVPQLNIGDARLLDFASRADRVGVDAPFGWPNTFIRAVSAHHRWRLWPTARLKALRFRMTDRFVRERVSRWPLSVSSEKIGVTAMRAARVLSQLAAEGEPVDRTGGGKWVEVYPVAALRHWGLKPDGYKKRDARARRRELLNELGVGPGGPLEASEEVREACETSHDCLDALIAALVARAAALGLCEPVPEGMVALAGNEGWIALPKPGTLTQLLACPPRVQDGG